MLQPQPQPLLLLLLLLLLVLGQCYRRLRRLVLAAAWL
jgi:hypothetical protein